MIKFWIHFSSLKNRLGVCVNQFDRKVIFNFLYNPSQHLLFNVKQFGRAIFTCVLKMQISCLAFPFMCGWERHHLSETTLKKMWKVSYKEILKLHRGIFTLPHRKLLKRTCYIYFILYENSELYNFASNLVDHNESCGFGVLII